MRLLATVYLEWDCDRFQEKALNAVSLANKVRYMKSFSHCDLHMHFGACINQKKKQKNRIDAMQLMALCNLAGMCECLWAVLKDQNTPEMQGLR